MAIQISLMVYSIILIFVTISIINIFETGIIENTIQFIKNPIESMHAPGNNNYINFNLETTGPPEIKQGRVTGG